MNELVLSSNGKLVTTSLLVAEKFHKRHTHVLDSIKNVITNTNQLAEISAPSMFTESQHVDEKGEERAMYYIDRDGFSLLVMGFTGKKALKFKLDYIAAFNGMEAKLKAIQQPINNTPELSMAEELLQSARILVENEKKIAAIEEKVNRMHKVLEDNVNELFSIPLSDEEVKPVELRKQVSMWIKR